MLNLKIGQSQILDAPMNEKDPEFLKYLDQKGYLDPAKMLTRDQKRQKYEEFLREQRRKHLSQNITKKPYHMINDN